MNNTSIEKIQIENKTKKWVWFIVVEILLCIILLIIYDFGSPYCGPFDNRAVCVLGSILGIFLINMGLPYIIALIFARNKHLHTVAFVCSLFLLISQFFNEIVAPFIFAPNEQQINYVKRKDITISPVTLASIAKGNLLKVDGSCDIAVYCRDINVKVRNVRISDTEQARFLIHDFFNNAPVSLWDCVRDEQFNLLCDVSDGKGRDLASELIKAGLGKQLTRLKRQ